MDQRMQIGDMFWNEYDERVKRPDSIVFLPVSSTEQHGPHTSLGCDALVGMAIANEVARRVGGMVAPPVAFGYKSQPRTGAGDHYPGNISLEGETLSMIVTDLLLEFVRHGARRIALIDSHYENHWFIVEGIEDAFQQMTEELRSAVKVVKFRYNELCTQETIDAVFGDDFLGWELEHAAVMTTSVLLHVRPDVVDMSVAPSHEPVTHPPYDVYPFDRSLGSRSGALSASTGASREKGKLFFENYVEAISNALEHEFIAHSPKEK